MIWITKLFADDTSWSSVVHNITDLTNLWNSNISKINKWSLQWKLSFDKHLMSVWTKITKTIDCLQKLSRILF